MRKTPAINVIPLTSLTMLNTVEAARMLAVAPGTMANWRVHGEGPAFVRINGKSIRYELRELQAYIEAGRARSTSEADHRTAA